MVAAVTLAEKERAGLEQFFNVVDVFFIDQKQDHVVVGFNNGITVCNDHLIFAHNSPDSGARRELNLADLAADYLRGVFITMGDRLYSFCGPTAK